MYRNCLYTLIPTADVTIPMLNRSVHEAWDGARIITDNGVSYYVVKFLEETARLHPTFDNYEWYTWEQIQEKLNA